MSILRLAKSFFSSKNTIKMKNFEKSIQIINALEKEMELLSNDQLFSKTFEFRERIKQGVKLDCIMEQAFAVVREVAKRQMGMRHFDVQIIGGIVLHSGAIAEMKTGEGKTLVATLAAYLNALSGNGVHVVTVNDYLTKRDSDWMSSIYNALGLKVGCVLSNMESKERKAAYAMDITYGTNNEFGFDYLRDNMCFNKDDIIQRPFNYAIIDEIDSILIDESRTPLIISDSVDNELGSYYKINKVVKNLNKDDYSVDEKERCVFLTDSGISKIEKDLAKEGLIADGTELYSIDNFGVVHNINQSLRAHKLFEVNRDYIVNDGKIIIIDEFTGRMMQGRRYSDGLHQAIEAKEGVKVYSESQTLTSITFQNYFRMYPKFSGMTGTAATESEEFENIYNLRVVQIPTNVPVQRIDYDDAIYKTEQEKYEAIVELIKKCNSKNQPVLVGTVSIEKSEKLSKILKKEQLKHQVLNAKYHEKEACIIMQAGCPGAITIATNMAGRGTDIKLGGNVEMAFLDYEKTHLQKIDKESEEYLEIKKSFWERFQQQKEEVLKAGGLYVIGTERHESRRIDNQLRGRSGRQGDIGSSKFFISLEDDLMRIFGSEKIGNMLTKIGLKYGEAIQHPWINKTIQKAQQKIESKNYELRKNIMKFDDIINEQRFVIFKQRRQVIEGSEEEIIESFEAIREQVNKSIVEKISNSGKYPEEWDCNNFDMFFKKLYGFHVDIKKWINEEYFSEEILLERINDITSKYFEFIIDKLGKEETAKIQKQIWLVVIGKIWAENLAYLDGLRSGIHLRAMGSKDPFVEYSREAFEAFSACLEKIDEFCIISFSRAIAEEHQNNTNVINIKKQSSTPIVLIERKKIEPEDRDPNNHKTWGIVSRNEQCPCGSGRKYKNCCDKIYT